MADIFDEVEQDLRADRARRAFARYGAILGAVAVTVLVGIAGLQGWRQWEARAAASTATRYLAASDAVAGDAATGDAFAAMAADSPAGYAALARLRAAAALAERGDAAGARAQWDALAQSAGPPLYRELAVLLGALAAIGTEPAAAIEARLVPIATGPWRASVAEARALIAQAAGDGATAARLFAAIASDPGSPQGVRIRAERLRGAEGG